MSASKSKATSAKSHLRLLFPNISDKRTTAEIFNGDFTKINLVTALSDLKNAKYAGKGALLLNIRKVDANTYQRLELGAKSAPAAAPAAE